MTTGNDSKITDIPLVKTEVVFGWIPAYVHFPWVRVGGRYGECSPCQKTQIVNPQTEECLSYGGSYLAYCKM